MPLCAGGQHRPATLETSSCCGRDGSLLRNGLGLLLRGSEQIYLTKSGLEANYLYTVDVVG